MPIYENDETLADERIMRDKIEAKWGWDTTKLPEQFRVEVVCQDPEILITTAYAECKRRHNPATEYDWYMVSKGKIDAGVSLALADAVSFILWIWFDDGHKWLDVMSLPMHEIHYGMGGRRDRGNPNDVEMMAYIPVYNFKQEDEW